MATQQELITNTDSVLSNNRTPPTRGNDLNLLFKNIINSIFAIMETPNVTKLINYSIISSDFTIKANCINQNILFTLPDATVNYGNFFNIKKIDNTPNLLTINTVNSQTIDGSSSKSISIKYNSYTIQSDGINWDII